MFHIFTFQNIQTYAKEIGPGEYSMDLLAPWTNSVLYTWTFN